MRTVIAISSCFLDAASPCQDTLSLYDDSDAQPSPVVPVDEEVVVGTSQLLLHAVKLVLPQGLELQPGFRSLRVVKGNIGCWDVAESLWHQQTQRLCQVRCGGTAVPSRYSQRNPAEHPST